MTSKVISVAVDAKCGCCNWENGKFFALEGQNPLPAWILEDDDKTPMDDYKEIFEQYKEFGEPVGMCGECFANWIEEQQVGIVYEK